jgi:metal transporter CNNM
MQTLVFIASVSGLILTSSVCSGLNISLMSLEVSDLKRRAKHGDKRAKRVLPFRQNSHLSLASILLTNVGAVSATSLVIEERLGGLIAGLASTLLIVILGEIVPQAIFSKRALTFTDAFTPLLRLMTTTTYPVSKPLQLLLDRVFGHETSKLHSRQELGMIISEHIHDEQSELDDDEVGIMNGALSLSNKRVRDIMTPIRHVYWMTPDTLIDAAKIDQIKLENWSRIPIFDKKRTECFGVLLMKDLVDMDFDEEPRYVRDLTLRKTRLVGSMTALDTMLRKFINAHTHLMPIEKDDKIVGIATIEDVIEEIIGREIEDESDTHR